MSVLLWALFPVGVHAKSGVLESLEPVLTRGTEQDDLVHEKEDPHEVRYKKETGNSSVNLQKTRNRLRQIIHEVTGLPENLIHVHFHYEKGPLLAIATSESLKDHLARGHFNPSAEDIIKKNLKVLYGSRPITYPGVIFIVGEDLLRDVQNDDELYGTFLHEWGHEKTAIEAQKKLDHRVKEALQFRSDITTRFVRRALQNFASQGEELGVDGFAQLELLRMRRYPRALIDFFSRRIDKKQEQEWSGDVVLGKTHPLSSKRVAALQGQLKYVERDREIYPVSLVDKEPETVVLTELNQLRQQPGFLEEVRTLVRADLAVAKASFISKLENFEIPGPHLLNSDVTIAAIPADPNLASEYETQKNEIQRELDAIKWSKFFERVFVLLRNNSEDILEYSYWNKFTGGLDAVRSEVHRTLTPKQKENLDLAMRRHRERGIRLLTQFLEAGDTAKLARGLAVTGRGLFDEFIESVEPLLGADAPGEARKNTLIKALWSTVEFKSDYSNFQVNNWELNGVIEITKKIAQNSPEIIARNFERFFNVDRSYSYGGGDARAKPHSDELKDVLRDVVERAPASVVVRSDFPLEDIFAWAGVSEPVAVPLLMTHCRSQFTFFEQADSFRVSALFHFLQRHPLAADALLPEVIKALNYFQELLSGPGVPIVENHPLLGALGWRDSDDSQLPGAKPRIANLIDEIIAPLRSSPIVVAHPAFIHLAASIAEFQDAEGQKRRLAREEVMRKAAELPKEAIASMNIFGLLDRDIIGAIDRTAVAKLIGSLERTLDQVLSQTLDRRDGENPRRIAVQRQLRVGASLLALQPERYPEFARKLDSVRLEIWEGAFQSWDSLYNLRNLAILRTIFPPPAEISRESALRMAQNARGPRGIALVEEVFNYHFSVSEILSLSRKPQELSNILRDLHRPPASAIETALYISKVLQPLRDQWLARDGLEDRYGYIFSLALNAANWIIREDPEILRLYGGSEKPIQDFMTTWPALLARRLERTHGKRAAVRKLMALAVSDTEAAKHFISQIRDEILQRTDPDDLQTLAELYTRSGKTGGGDNIVPLRSDFVRARILVALPQSRLPLMTQLRIVKSIASDLTPEESRRLWLHYRNTQLDGRPYSQSRAEILLTNIFPDAYELRWNAMQEVFDDFKLKEQEMETLRESAFPEREGAVTYELANRVSEFIRANMKSAEENIEFIRWLQGRTEIMPDMVQRVVDGVRGAKSRSSIADIAMRETMKNFSAARLRNLYKNSPAVVRGFLLNPFVFDKNERSLTASEGGRQLLFDYILEGIEVKNRKLFQTLFEAYAYGQGEEGHLFLTQALATGDGTTTSLNDAEKARTLSEQRGALWIKFIQQMSVDPTLIPDANVRKVFAVLKDRAAVPTREEIFRMLKKAMGSEYSKVKNVHGILGSGSINVTVLLEFHDGTFSVARMVKDNPENAAAHEIRAIRRMKEFIDRKSGEDPDVGFRSTLSKISAAFVEYLEPLERKIGQEVDLRQEGPRAERLATAYNQNYADLKVEVRILPPGSSLVVFDAAGGKCDPERIVFYRPLRDIRESLSPDEEARVRQAQFRAETRAPLTGAFDPDGHDKNWIFERDPHDPTRLIAWRIDYSQMEEAEPVQYRSLGQFLSLVSTLPQVSLRLGFIQRRLFETFNQIVEWDASVPVESRQRICMDALAAANSDMSAHSPVEKLLSMIASIRTTYPQGVKFPFAVKMMLKSLHITNPYLADEIDFESRAKVSERLQAWWTLPRPFADAASWVYSIAGGASRPSENSQANMEAVNVERANRLHSLIENGKKRPVSHSETEILLDALVAGELKPADLEEVFIQALETTDKWDIPQWVGTFASIYSKKEMTRLMKRALRAGKGLRVALEMHEPDLLDECFRLAFQTPNLGDVLDELKSLDVRGPLLRWLRPNISQATSLQLVDLEFFSWVVENRLETQIRDINSMDALISTWAYSHNETEREGIRNRIRSTLRAGVERRLTEGDPSKYKDRFENAEEVRTFLNWFSNDRGRIVKAVRNLDDWHFIQECYQIIQPINSFEPDRLSYYEGELLRIFATDEIIQVVAGSDPRFARFKREAKQDVNPTEMAENARAKWRAEAITFLRDGGSLYGLMQNLESLSVEDFQFIRADAIRSLSEAGENYSDSVRRLGRFLDSLAEHSRKIETEAIPVLLDFLKHFDELVYGRGEQSKAGDSIREARRRLFKRLNDRRAILFQRKLFSSDAVWYATIEDYFTQNPAGAEDVSWINEAIWSEILLSKGYFYSEQLRVPRDIGKIWGALVFDSPTTAELFAKNLDEMLQIRTVKEAPWNHAARRVLFVDGETPLGRISAVASNRTADREPLQALLNTCIKVRKVMPSGPNPHRN